MRHELRRAVPGMAQKAGGGGLTMSELKPCPFCGCKDSGILTTPYDGYWFAVFCENCMAQTRKCRQEKDAVEAWNRRAGAEDKHENYT